MSEPSERVRHDVAWLPIVRWTTCAVLWAMSVVIWTLPALNLSLRAVAPFIVTAALCRTCVVLFERKERRAPRILGLSLCADAALMTGLLDITGGPFNPFIVMFVPYIWLAGLTLSVRWTVLVATVSVVGFGWLVIDHVRAEAVEHHSLNDFPAHLFTMWLAGAAIAELVAVYVTRARDALAHRQQQVDAARERALRSEHLASLTTLAAGAAHELSTPLATIAVAARELERRADRLSGELPPVEALAADARLIRTEVDRCQVILDSMSGRAPGGATSASEPLPPSSIVGLVHARLSAEQCARLQVSVAVDAPAPDAPGAAMVQAIASLLKNAFDASAPAGAVRLQFTRRDEFVQIAVHDDGTGMSPEALRRAGEPFFTTKPAGRGMGLGLFLTRAFAERAGGSLRFDTGGGTTAVLEIPAAPSREPVA